MMKNTLLGNNDDSLPREQVIPKEMHLKKQLIPLEVETRSARYHNTIKLAFNGKGVVLNEQLIILHSDNPTVSSFFTFYTLNDDGEMSIAHNKRFSSKDYLDYVVSNSYRFVIMAHNLGNGMFSLGGRILENGNAVEDYFNDIKLFTIEAEKRKTKNVLLRLTVDDKTLCVIIDSYKDRDCFCAMLTFLNAINGWPNFIRENFFGGFTCNGFIICKTLFLQFFG